MLDEEKIKSIIPTSQDIMLVFFFKKIQFQLYSNILNNISMLKSKFSLFVLENCSYNSKYSLIFLMNMVVKIVNYKYYGKVNTEKVNRRRLYYLYTIGFFSFYFFLLIVECQSRVSNY